MKILFYCRHYLPLVGGLPIRMRIMAEQFAAAGHSVTVVTDTPGNDLADDAVTTLRGISLGALRRVAMQQDVLMSANISLKAVPVLLSARKPVFVAHGGGYFNQGWMASLSKAKLALCQLVHNIYNSQAVATWVGAPGVVLPNTYRDDVFFKQDRITRDADMVAFGRLVSDKGFATVIDAIALLKARGHERQLTIIGDGPEREPLSQQAQEARLAGQVDFVGELNSAGLAQALCKCRIAVIPSLWREPFGNVVLEALGCGCIPIVSDGGGLPEAVGPCGLTFERGNSASLAEAITQSDQIDAGASDYLELRQAHLERYRPARVAAAYVKEFERVLAGKALPIGSPEGATVLAEQYPLGSAHD